MAKQNMKVTPSPSTKSSSTNSTQDIVLKKMSDNHIRVAVVGNVDAGKSTLISTLVTSTLDDGRGTARSRIVKHKHELLSGRTSTIETYLLALDENANAMAGLPENEAALRSNRLVSLMDLAGHEKYMKTTIAGIARGMADYALVLVNASQPPTHMTRHHLSLCVGMGISVVVVLTKTDRCPQHVFKSTMDEIKNILRSPDIQKRPFMIKTTEDIATVKDMVFATSPWTPVISVSAVSGDGLPLLRQLLADLPPRRCHEKKHRHKPFEYLVEEVFTVPGVGTVLSGFVSRGEWKKGEPLFIGPLKNGEIYQTVPKAAHVAKTPVDCCWAGHSVCFAIPKPARTNRKWFTKGMVALKESFVLTKTFVADVYWTKGGSLGSGVTVQSNRFEATINMLNNKFPAKVLNITVDGKPQETVRQGVRALVTFELTNQQAYVRPGMKIILRDGHVRGFGIVKSLLDS